MTTAACHRCGAPLRAPAPLYCPSCGARQALGVDDLDAYRANPERYELVARHPAYAAAMRWAPRLSAWTELGLPVALFLWFLLFSGAIFAIAARVDDLPVMFPIIAGLVVAAALVPLVTALLRFRAPLERVIAVIADDVVRPHRGGDPAGVANHRVTLRTADGRQRDALATGELMGVVVLADIGVAYLRGRRLVDFRAFDVMPPPRAPGEPARPPTCGECAAPYTFSQRDRCAFCSAPLALPDLGEHGARFAKVLADPATRAALAQPMDGVVPPYGLAVFLLALALLTAYGLWSLAFLWFFLAEEAPLGLLALIPPVVFICAAVIYGRRRLTPHLAKRRVEVALVVRERKDSWMSVNGRPIWEHHVTLAGPGGGRLERRALELVAHEVEPGQIGVACLRGDWLAGFTVLSRPPPPRRGA